MQSVTIRTGDSNLSPEEIEKRKQKAAARDKGDSSAELRVSGRKTDRKEEEREKLPGCFLKKDTRPAWSRSPREIAETPISRSRAALTGGRSDIRQFTAQLPQVKDAPRSSSIRKAEVRGLAGERGSREIHEHLQAETIRPRVSSLSTSKYHKHYAWRGNVHACAGVTADSSQRISRHHGTERQRQIHPHNMLGCLRYAELGRYDSTARTFLNGWG